MRKFYGYGSNRHGQVAQRDYKYRVRSRPRVYGQHRLYSLGSGDIFSFREGGKQYVYVGTAANGRTRVRLIDTGVEYSVRPSAYVFLIYHDD